MGSVNGTAVGSVEYSLGGVGDGFLTVDYDVWNSLDCSGDATSGSYVVKTECDLHEGRSIFTYFINFFQSYCLYLALIF